MLLLLPKKGYTARRVLPKWRFSANSAKFGKTKCGRHKNVACGSEPFLSRSRGVSSPKPLYFSHFSAYPPDLEYEMVTQQPFLIVKSVRGI
jgi:hypothetical protein